MIHVCNKHPNKHVNNVVELYHIHSYQTTKHVGGITTRHHRYRLAQAGVGRWPTYVRLAGCRQHLIENPAWFLPMGRWENHRKTLVNL